MAVATRLIFLTIGTAWGQFGAIKIDWQHGNGFSSPSLDLSRLTDEIDPVAAEDHKQALSEALRGLPREHLQGLVVAFGLKSPLGSDSDDSSSEVVKKLLRATTGQLNTVLLDRGAEPCDESVGRVELLRRVLEAAHKPVLRRHRLPLFYMDGHQLFPHARMMLHLYEGKEQRMVQQALLSDRTFGFVWSDRHGTLANITQWRITNDGGCKLFVEGLQRFTFGVCIILIGQTCVHACLRALLANYNKLLASSLIPRLGGPTLCLFAAPPPRLLAPINHHEWAGMGRARAGLE